MKLYFDKFLVQKEFMTHYFRGQSHQTSFVKSARLKLYVLFGTYMELQVKFFFVQVGLEIRHLKLSNQI